MRAALVAWLDRRQARAVARAKVKYPPPPRSSGAVSTGRYSGDSKVAATFHPEVPS